MGNSKLVGLGFGWMKVVFEWWIMCGMMFGSDWVKKFCDLVMI